MSLKPTFRPVLLVFFRLLKCYQNGGSFCCDVQLCNRTRRIVIITRRANDVKMRGKIVFVVIIVLIIIIISMAHLNIFK